MTAIGYNGHGKPCLMTLIKSWACWFVYRNHRFDNRATASVWIIPGTEVDEE